MITATDTHSALFLFHLRAAELHAEARRHSIARAASVNGAASADGTASVDGATPIRRGWLRRRIRAREGPQPRHGRSEPRAPALP